MHMSPSTFSLGKYSASILHPSPYKKLQHAWLLATCLVSPQKHESHRPITPSQDSRLHLPRHKRTLLGDTYIHTYLHTYTHAYMRTDDSNTCVFIHTYSLTYIPHRPSPRTRTLDPARTTQVSRSNAKHRTERASASTLIRSSAVYL